MRIWARIKRHLLSDKGRCWNCGEPLSPSDRGHVHERCVQEYDDRMAW